MRSVLTDLKRNTSNEHFVFTLPQVLIVLIFTMGRVVLGVFTFLLRISASHLLERNRNFIFTVIHVVDQFLNDTMIFSDSERQEKRKIETLTL